MTPPPTNISRITVDDCADDRRIQRVVIQEAGIPGPVGTGGADLSSVDFVPPLTYDPQANSIFLAPPPANGQAWKWDGLQWVAIAIPQRRVEHRVITESEEIAKEFALAHTVSDPAKIAFDISHGGGPQFLDSDFFLVGNRIIRWADSPLDGVLAAGDKIRVVYE